MSHVTRKKKRSQFNQPNQSKPIDPQIVVIVPPRFPPGEHHLADASVLGLFVLVSERCEEAAQLIVGGAAPELAGPGHGQQAVLDVAGAFGVDEGDTAQAVSGLRGQNLRQDAAARGGFGFGFAVFVLALLWALLILGFVLLVFEEERKERGWGVR